MKAAEHVAREAPSAALHHWWCSHGMVVAAKECMPSAIVCLQKPALAFDLALWQHTSAQAAGCQPDGVLSH